MTQLAIYKWYISGIYCQLGDYIYNLPPIKGTRNSYWQRCVMPCIKPDLKLWIARICRKKSPSPLSQSSCQWSAEDIKTSKLTLTIWISPEIILNRSKILSQILKNAHPQAWQKCIKTMLHPYETPVSFSSSLSFHDLRNLATETWDDGCLPSDLDPPGGLGWFGIPPNLMETSRWW